MKLYADTPGRRTWQLVTDLFVVAWLWFWIWLAVKLYHLVGTLAVPGQKLTGAGDGMANGLADAGSKVHRVPVAGDSLAEPFTRAADAARSIADAGRTEQHTVHQLAWVLALLLLSVPLAVVVLGRLPSSRKVYRPSVTRLATRASSASVLSHSAVNSASIRRRDCWQNSSASSRPAGSASLRARTQVAAIANSSAPMSTTRPRNPCLRSIFPRQRAIA